VRLVVYVALRIQNADIVEIPATSWRTVPDYQGGFLLDGGVHFVAGLAAMLGPIASVSGTSTLQWEHLAPKDTIHAMCRTDEGVEGVRQSSCVLW
jgi:predicted dehydrogenase